MNFKEAYKLLKEGQLLKLKSWKGYWKWENETIMMYCKNGDVLDIRETQNVDFTISNTLEDNWEIATKDNCQLLNGITEPYTHKA